MQKDGLDFSEALKRIAHECGIDTKRTLNRTEHLSANDPQPQLPRSNQADFDLEAACAALSKTKDALDYLATRGISRDAAARRGLGVFHFPGVGPCVAIPYATGDVKLRAINPCDKADKFRAIGKPNDKLYGIEFVDQNSKALNLLIVESELDQIAASEHLGSAEFVVVSVSSATASISGGVLRIIPDHIEKLRTFGGRIFIATDQDDAGEKWEAAALKALPLEKTSRVTWSGAKDIGELFTKSGARFAATIRQLCEESLTPHLWRRAASFANLPEKKFEWVVDDLIPADGITRQPTKFCSVNPASSRVVVPLDFHRRS